VANVLILWFMVIWHRVLLSLIGHWTCNHMEKLVAKGLTGMEVEKSKWTGVAMKRLMDEVAVGNERPSI